MVSLVDAVTLPHCLTVLLYCTILNCLPHVAFCVRKKPQAVSPVDVVAVGSLLRNRDWGAMKVLDAGDAQKGTP